MTTRMTMAVFASLAGLLVVLWISGTEAKQTTPPPAVTKPTTPPPAKVAGAPVCDVLAHPKITKVTPDTVKPGQRITIKGNKFGTKECFQNVSFGSVGTNDYKYVNDTTLEAT